MCTTRQDKFPLTILLASTCYKAVYQLLGMLFILSQNKHAFELYISVNNTDHKFWIDLSFSMLQPTPGCVDGCLEEYPCPEMNADYSNYGDVCGGELLTCVYWCDLVFSSISIFNWQMDGKLITFCNPFLQNIYPTWISHWVICSMSATSQ